jgi:hypothetical protein
MSFAQSAFAQFMSSPAGRIIRIIAGVVLIGWGYSARDQTAGIVLMIVGFLPLLAGAFDICVITGLLGGPFRGPAIRQTAKR